MSLEASPKDAAGHSADDAERRDVDDRLSGYRKNLYGGRGPGISERDWLRNTSLRPAVAGVPVAVSREQVHIRTLRARGAQQRAAAEAQWATAQGLALGEPASADGEPGTRRRKRSGPGETHHFAAARRDLAGLGWLVAAWLWSRSRRNSRASAAVNQERNRRSPEK